MMAAGWSVGVGAVTALGSFRLLRAAKRDPIRVYPCSSVVSIMHLTLEQSFATAVRPSQRVLQTASMFGLGVDEERIIHILPRTEIDLPSRGIVFITGPSGGGKSSILKAIKMQLAARKQTIIDLAQPAPLPDAPLVDVFDIPLKRAASILAMAGLGDAFIMLRRPCELSDGQRARLRLAQAMHLASQSREPAYIIADEFTATLDRLTATIISRNIRRWIDRADSPITFIAATTHEDIADALAPNLLIYKGLGNEIDIQREPVHLEPAQSVHGIDNLKIEPATTADYKPLAQFHYRSERAGVTTSAFRMVCDEPAIVGRYLQRKSEHQLIGVLLRSLPHLSCSLRNHATRGRYCGLAPREAATLLNREVRTISRVVIHPQWRGLGLAAQLVKHALSHPEEKQVFTEALAAMGHVHPFFERAGMVRFDRPPRKQHARLLDVLDRLGIEPFMLASPKQFLNLLRERDEDEQVWFEHELARWVRSGARRTRRQTASRRSAVVGDEPTIENMLATARDQLLTLPIYYLHRH